MRAVRCSEGSLEVVDVPAPSRPGVRVRIRSAGICGSDLHLVDSGFPLGHTLGHEMAGELADGSGVAIEPLIPCGACDICAEGAYNRCRSGSGIIMGIGFDGGMAEEVVVPERCLVPLAPGVAARDACLVEPLAVAVHGLAAAGLRAGQRVAVVGGGSIGLCAVACAVEAGAEVALLARHDSQAAAGERLGARAGAVEYDLVVDCAGTPSALEQAVALCRPGGCLLLLATYWQGLTLPAFALSMKEVRVIPSNMYARTGAGRDVDAAAALLAQRPEIAATVITHRLPLEAAAEAFAIAADRRAGAIKVVLEP
jgi:threonine dehydrogenase-like Zn-dependent dehydrogenase